VDVMSYKLKKILPLDMELLVPATSKKVKIRIILIPVAQY